MQSFKVLTECPLIVMLLYQLYKHNIAAHIERLVPLMTAALSLKAPLPAEAQLTDPRFPEFVACQVKTLSFLTYLLRSFSTALTSFRDSISLCVRDLLAACPESAVQTRKEILVATRHILATPFRRAFYDDVNLFLDETVLIGAGRACHDSLRPLAYSTLADLVHHVRYDLTLDQLSRIIHLFSRNIHDPTLPISIQTTSVRLLLNLVDNIFHNTDADAAKGRGLLTRILSTLVHKFGTLQHYIPRVLAELKATAAKRADAVTHERDITNAMLRCRDVPSGAPEAAGGAAAADANGDDGAGAAAGAGAGAGAGAVASPPLDLPLLHEEKNIPFSDMTKWDRTLGTVKDVKSLVKTMTLGLKTVVWCASNYRREAAGAPAAGTAAGGCGAATGSAAAAGGAAGRGKGKGPAKGSGKGKAPKSKAKGRSKGSGKAAPASTTSVAAGGVDGAPGAPVLSPLPTTGADANVLSEMELRFIAKFFKWGLRCFQMLGGGVGSGGEAHMPVEEEKEVLDHFGGVFTVMDVCNFKDVLHGSMRLYFGHVVRHPPLMGIAKHFLLNHTAAGSFFELVLRFIVQHLHLLNVEAVARHTLPDSLAAIRARRPPQPGTAQTRDDIGRLTDVSFPTTDGTADATICAAVLLRLFKISIASITHLYQDNEKILRPYLAVLVRGCVRNAASCTQPIHHLFVLRSLFRAVAHRKFELLYEEFPPLIPMLLESFVRMYHTLSDTVLKDLVIELCLTIPARLESQLPHLPQLMLPLIAALRSKQEKNELAVVG